jgi:phosphopantothenoylcysteine decarboxylase/phosphopantothenate--cysteine ligase
MARILLGVSGGIAAYRALDFVRLATGAGHAVRVIQTPAALRFVGAASFAGLTGAPVLVEEWERDPARGVFPDQAPPEHDPLSHLELVRNADVYLVAPATANTIAKLADNLLTRAALASDVPLVVAPAMNDRMWHHPATQANLDTLRSRGATIVEPGTGRLASKGEQGTGRLAPIDVLLDVALRAAGGASTGVSTAGPWAGRHVLVTAGGTREPIDSVRYVGNRSSGRMGFALAAGASARGADVTLVAANVALETPAGVERVDVETAAELKAAVDAAFPGCDALLMAAAVADFRPSDPVDAKIKKTERDDLTVTLEPTEDVLAGVSGRREPGQTIVGFAAEHGEQALSYGADKLARKGLDAIVVNDISQPGIGFDTPDNEVTILTASDTIPVPRASKDAVAAAILDVVDRLMGPDEGETPPRVDGA